MTIFTKSRVNKDTDFLVNKNSAIGFVSTPISFDLQTKLALLVAGSGAGIAGNLTLQAAVGTTAADGSPDVSTWINLINAEFVAGVVDKINGVTVPAYLQNTYVLFETETACNWLRLQWLPNASSGTFNASFVKKTFA